MSQSLGVFDVLLLFVYLSPFFLLMLIPVACMLAMFVTFLRMSNERELLALKAGGVSLYQTLRAPALFCLLCAAATLYVSLHGVSWGMGHFRETVLEFAKAKTQLVLQAGVFNREFPGLTIFARQVEQEEGELADVFVEDRTRADSPTVIVAPRGRLASDSARGALNITLADGRIYAQRQGATQVLEFSEYEVRLDLANMLKGTDLAGEPRPKELSWKTLLKLEKDQKAREGRDARYLRKISVEKHKRLALPVACLALGLFAMPLGCAFQGLRQSLGLTMAMGFFLLYYSLLSLGLGLSESGTVRPELGVWGPDVIFFVLGLAALRMAATERAPSLGRLLPGGARGSGGTSAESGAS